MRKLSLHLAIACCTFGLSVFLTSIWNWGTHADIRVTVYDEKSDSLSSVSKYEPGLVEIYRNYGSAQTKHDVAFFERVEAESFTLFTGGKALSRTQAIHLLKRFPDIVYELDDVQIELYGDAAIVKGRITATGQHGFKSSWRWIDICAKREGRWQIQSTTQIN